MLILNIYIISCALNRRPFFTYVRNLLSGDYNNMILIILSINMFGQLYFNNEKYNNNNDFDYVNNISIYCNLHHYTLPRLIEHWTLIVHYSDLFIWRFFCYLVVPSIFHSFRPYIGRYFISTNKTIGINRGKI